MIGELVSWLILLLWFSFKVTRWEQVEEGEVRAPAAERDSSSTAFIHSKVWLTPRLHTNTAAHRENWLTAWRHRVSAVSHPETHRGQIRTEVSHNTVFTVDWRQHRRSDALLFWALSVLICSGLNVRISVTLGYKEGFLVSSVNLKLIF